MKQYLIVATALIVLSSCVASKKDKDAALNVKKATLEKLKKEKSTLDDKIIALEKDITKLDPASSTAQKPKLVSLQELQPSAFDHYIELQGRIDAENISYISPRTGPAQVKAVLVQKGSYVKKRPVIIKA